MIACRLVPLGLLPLLTCLAAPAAAQSLVICHIGGPGSTAQAQPVLDKFLRHVERVGGLARGSMSGEYHTTLAGCRGYIQRARPLFGVLDLPTYLAENKSLALKPLACMGSPTEERYHLLVREGSYKDLASLAGKTLYVGIDDPSFLSRIVFDGKLDAAKQFRIKSARRPLKGIRMVARDRADAALVSALAYQHLDELKLPTKLTSIYTSPGLPGLTLAVLGLAKPNPTVVKKVTAALPKLCAGDGAKMCKTFQVTSFTRVQPAAYRRLVRKYGK